MADNQLKYWAFLACSPQDNHGQHPDHPPASRRCWGDELRHTLEAFSVPAEFAGQINARGEIIPDRIHPIFQDVTEQSDDAGLNAEIRQALEQSRCLVVICSPHSAPSRHVNEIVRYFKQLGRNRQIFPIVVAGEPYASDGRPGLSPEHECFVPALRHPVRPDGTVETARRAGKFIFVDARHGIDKREILATDHRNAEADLEMAKVQLIALLLGVGFNGLWWREQRRHFIDFTEARQRVREAQEQVGEIQRQLTEARRQVHEAQNRVLEAQNLPRDVHGQIKEAQAKAQEAESQALTAQKQLQELQNKVRETQGQLEETRNRALAAESKFLEAQNQTQEARRQAEESRLQLQESRSQAQAVPEQILETRQQAEESRHQILEFQSQVQKAQAQVQEARNQAGEAQGKVREIQNSTRQARRLTKVLAVMAVLALMSAGTAIGIAWRQHQAAHQAWAKLAALAAWEPDLTRPKIDLEQIRLALLKIGSAEQEPNRQRSLNKLAAWIPTAEIPEAVRVASLIADDPQRVRFQKQLLIRLGWVNSLSAMTSASAISGKIVNDDGMPDSSSYFQLAVLDNWMQTDLPGAFNWVCQLPEADARDRALEKIIPAQIAADPTNTLARLNELKPAPAKRIYMQMFQRLAAADPVQAIQQWQQLPNQNGTLLCTIMTVWMEQQPEAALDWVKAQPDSKARNQALATCITELAKTDAPQALALAESLPEGNWRSTMLAGVFKIWAVRDVTAATAACLQLPDGPAKDRAWDCILDQRLATNPAADPEAAVHWLDSLLQTNAQPEQLSSAIKAWAEAEPAAVAGWLADLPADTASEAMTNAFLTGAVMKYPEYAAQWTQSVTNETERQKYQIQAARQWMKADPSAAWRWLDSLDLPEAAKQPLKTESP